MMTPFLSELSEVRLGKSSKRCGWTAPWGNGGVTLHGSGCFQEEGGGVLVQPLLGLQHRVLKLGLLVDVAGASKHTHRHT